MNIEIKSLNYLKNKKIYDDIMSYMRTNTCPCCKEKSVFYGAELNVPYPLYGLVCSCCGALYELELDVYSDIQYRDWFYIPEVVEARCRMNIKDDVKLKKGLYDILKFFAKYEVLAIGEAEVMHEFRKHTIKMTK